MTTPTPRMPSFDLAALSADVSGLLDEALPALEAARRPLQLESVACLLCLPMRDPGVPRAAADVVASAVARRAEPAARELLEALATIAPRQLAVAAADRLGATAAAGRRAPAIDAVRAMRDAQVDVVAWTCTADGQDFLGHVVVERREDRVAVDGSLDPVVPGDARDLFDLLAPAEDAEHVTEVDLAGARERARAALDAAAQARGACSERFAMSEALLAWCLDDAPLSWPPLPAVAAAQRVPGGAPAPARARPSKGGKGGRRRRRR